jgi:ABC-type oligopeptide transport system ATPase subunit
VGRTLLRLEEATSGKVDFDGIDILRLSKEEMRRIRKRMQIIFQDPYASLNPREKIRTVIGHALAVHRIGTPNDREGRMVALLGQVGLSADYLDRFPHEFSGGQRQRIGIARALAVDPDFVVADEPVSALDVSIQAQVINLLDDLKDRFNLTMLFIAHDLAVVEHICDRVIVMYLGRIMEVAPASGLYSNPNHPYTQALLSAVQSRGPGGDGPGSFSRGTSRAPSIRRPAACSGPVAPSPSPNARRSCRPSAPWASTTSAPASGPPEPPCLAQPRPGPHGLRRRQLGPVPLPKTHTSDGAHQSGADTNS